MYFRLKYIFVFIFPCAPWWTWPSNKNINLNTGKIQRSIFFVDDWIPNTRHQWSSTFGNVLLNLLILFCLIRWSIISNLTISNVDIDMAIQLFLRDPGIKRTKTQPTPPMVDITAPPSPWREEVVLPAVRWGSRPPRSKDPTIGSWCMLVVH